MSIYLDRYYIHFFYMSPASSTINWNIYTKSPFEWLVSKYKHLYELGYSVSMYLDIYYFRSFLLHQLV
jgi:hypothetical protein